MALIASEAIAQIAAYHPVPTKSAIEGLRAQGFGIFAYGTDVSVLRQVLRDGLCGLRAGEEYLIEHHGGCDCGNLQLLLRLSQPPEHTPLRACSCSFCRAHNTRTTSDPHGSVEIWARDWSLVQSYRFGSGTAEFLICRNCGVYIGAVCDTAAGIRAVININCLDDRVAFTRQPVSADRDQETTEDRLARRAANWTPATLHGRGRRGPEPSR